MSYYQPYQPFNRPQTTRPTIVYVPSNHPFLVNPVPAYVLPQFNGPAIPFAQADYTPQRVSFYIRSEHNKFVLDVEGGSKSEGARVISWPRKKTDNLNQLFVFTPEGFIENVETGLVFDIEQGERGSSIVMRRKNPELPGSQRWQYDYTNHTFHSLCKGLVLDVEGERRDAGAPIIGWELKSQQNNHNQRFQLIPSNVPFPEPEKLVIPSDLPQGLFFIQSTFHNLVLDVEGGSRRRGAKVILWPKKNEGVQNQLWRFTPEGYIESADSKMVLDIKGDGWAGTKIIVWPRKDDDSHNQKWVFDSKSGNIYGKDKLVLDVEGEKRSAGTRACVWVEKPHPSNANQKWRLIPYKQ